MGKTKYKISYIKKPFARRGKISLSLSLISLALCGVSLFLSVRQQGQGELSVAAWAVSSLIFAVAALIYGGLSFLEKDKNYRLTRIGMWLAGVMMVLWCCVTVVGVIGR